MLLLSPVLGDHAGFGCMRLELNIVTRQEQRTNNIHSLYFFFPQCCCSDTCLFILSLIFCSMIQNVMYITMMALSVYKCINTNFQAKCILFLGLLLVKFIFRYWFLTQMFFCNFCTFFKLKVCIFIFLHMELPWSYTVAVLAM